MRMRYVTSLFLPLSSTKGHIASEKNEWTFRLSSTETRCNVSTFGVLGLELDISKEAEENLAIIKKHLTWYRENQTAIFSGRVYTQGVANRSSMYSFYVVSKEKVFVLAKIDNVNSKSVKSLKIPNLEKGTYVFKDQEFSSEYLKNQGLKLTDLFKQKRNSTIIFEIIKKK